MNKTKIEWCDMTWNPVTGCLHGCEYCYARKIASRFGGTDIYIGETMSRGMFMSNNGCMVLHCAMSKTDKKDNLRVAPFPYYFQPTFHEYRLGEPWEIKTPQKVFVCSMADLFGDWVDESWIEQVFSACEKAPWHQYLFLTKNAKRYKGIMHRPNWWFGATVTNSGAFIPPCNAEDLFKYGGVNTFLSIEPLLGEIHGIALQNVTKFRWVIIGQQTNPTVEPKSEWVQNIIDECYANNVPVFVKEPLFKRFPIQQYPEGLTGGKL
jgi:protein gp37